MYWECSLKRFPSKDAQSEKRRAVWSVVYPTEKAVPGLMRLNVYPNLRYFDNVVMENNFL